MSVALQILASTFIGALVTSPPLTLDTDVDKPLNLNFYYLDNSIDTKDNNNDYFVIGGVCDNKLSTSIYSYVYEFSFNVNTLSLNEYVSSLNFLSITPYSSTYNPRHDDNIDIAIMIYFDEDNNEDDLSYGLRVYTPFGSHPEFGNVLFNQLGLNILNIFNSESLMYNNTAGGPDYVNKFLLNSNVDFSKLDYVNNGNYYSSTIIFNSGFTYDKESDYTSFNCVFQFYSNFKGLSSSYEDGYNKGYDSGYNVGYSSGISQNPNLINPFALVFSGINNILSIEIFPNFKLLYVVGFGLFVGLLIFILGFFK